MKKSGKTVEEAVRVIYEATECAIVKFFNKQGVPELAYYCNFVDYIQSNVIGMRMQ